MSPIVYAFGWIALALLLATSAVLLPPLLVAGAWLTGWISNHHGHA